MYNNWEYGSFLRKRFALILVLVSVFTTLLPTASSSKSRVLLRDIETLTFHDGVKTAYSRARPVNQLECIGGSAARYQDYKPRAVQCYNSGFDGQSVQWKCNAELPKNVRFGRLDVNCEGYEYPEDKYVLAGSCALRYELDFKNSQSSHPPIKESRHWFGGALSGSKAYSSYLFIGGLLMIALALWYFCLRDSSPATNRHVPNSEPGTPIYPDRPPAYEEATRTYRPASATLRGQTYDTDTRFRAQPSAPPASETYYGWNMPPSGAGGRNTAPGHDSSSWRKSGTPPASSSTTTTTTTNSEDSGYGLLAGAAVAGAVALGAYLWGSSTGTETPRREVHRGRSTRRRSSSGHREVYTATGYAGTSRR